MAIDSIYSQPASGSLWANYRPIVLVAAARPDTSDGLPPVVYCDIYVNSQYYKSISKTVPKQIFYLGGGGIDYGHYEFDIQDALQEYLIFRVLVNGGFGILGASAYANNADTYIPVLCKFRSSHYDTDGFVVTENTAPIQGTGLIVPTAGTGTSSNTFNVFNATLQHHENQNLITHLDSYLTNNTVTTGVAKIAAIAPLTHRPLYYRICAGDSDYYPFVDSSGAHSYTILRLNYKPKGGVYAAIDHAISKASGMPQWIPAGPKNLTAAYPGAGDFRFIDEYYLEILNETPVVIFRTCYYKIGCCCITDKIRVHFGNTLGTTDAINFAEYHIVNDNSSSQYKKANPIPLTKQSTGFNRFNVRANDVYECKTDCYGEADMPWCMEMLNCPIAFIEWKGIEGQSDDFLPIVVLDAKFERRKTDERYWYELVIQFKMGNDKIIIRN